MRALPTSVCIKLDSQRHGRVMARPRGELSPRGRGRRRRWASGCKRRRSVSTTPAARCSCTKLNTALTTSSALTTARSEYFPSGPLVRFDVLRLLPPLCIAKRTSAALLQYSRLPPTPSSASGWPSYNKIGHGQPETRGRSAARARITGCRRRSYEGRGSSSRRMKLISLFVSSLASTN